MLNCGRHSSSGRSGSPLMLRSGCSAVLKLEPGCGATAIPLEPPVTVIVWPGRPEALCRTLLVTSSLTRSTAVSPAGCWRPSTAAANARATATRSGRPATATLSPATTPAMPAPPPPQPPAAPPLPSARRKGCELTAGRGNPAPSTLHSPASIKAMPGPRHAAGTPRSAPTQHADGKRSEVPRPDLPLQQLPRHHHALDLVRPLVDLGGRGPAVSFGK
jgi:hypothetical protein